MSVTSTRAALVKDDPDDPNATRKVWLEDTVLFGRFRYGRLVTQNLARGNFRGGSSPPSGIDPKQLI